MRTKLMNPWLLFIGLLACFGIVGHFDYEAAMETDKQYQQPLHSDATTQETMYSVTLKCRTMPVQMQSSNSQEPSGRIVRTRWAGAEKYVTFFQCVKA